MSNRITRTSTMVFLFLCLWLLVSFGAHGATPAALTAKQSAQSRGFLFETSHEEIVAKAKKEGNSGSSALSIPKPISSCPQALSRNTPLSILP